MMARSPLFGRRIHITGSVVDDLAVASGESVEQARTLVHATTNSWPRWVDDSTKDRSCGRKFPKTLRSSHRLVGAIPNCSARRRRPADAATRT